MLEKFIQTDNSLRAGKQLDMAFLRLKIAFVITVSVSSLLVTALWPVVEHGVLLFWLSAQTIVMAMRVVLIRRHAITKSDLALHKWKTEYTIGSAIAGINWGVALFIFHVALLEPTTLLLILVIVGVGAYASVSMAALLPAAVALLIPTLLPLSVWLFSFNYFLGAVALLYLGLMLLVTYQMHKVIQAAHLTTVQNEAQKIALDEIGQRMANYFENAPGFFFTLQRNADGHISMPFASTGITALFGLQPEQVAGNVSALVTLYNPEDRTMIFGEMQRSGQTLTPCGVMFRANHPEKGEIWVEARSMPKQDGEDCIRWNGFMQDITEQKQAEALLQKREREFRALAENAPDPIYRYDRNCRRIYINKAVEQLTGFPLSRILGKSPTEAMPNPSVDAIKAEQAIRRVLNTGTPGELEVSFVTADGRDITVHNLLVPEFSADGSVESVLCIGRDVTARKYMTDVLAKSERSFRTLAENASDHISRYDRQCRVIYLNPNFEATLGLAGGYLHNKLLAEVFSDGLFDDFEEAMKQVIASGQAANHYLVLPDTGDGERFHHVRMTPEKNDSGDVSGVLAIGRDITELKRYEQSLLARAELEQRQSQFFAIAPGAFSTLEHQADGSYVMRFISEGIRELYGLEPEAVMRDIGILVAQSHPDDVEMTFRKTEESERNLSPLHVDYRIMHPTKGELWIECRAVPKRLPDGGTRWDGFYHDITERKKMEWALLESEEKHRTVFESANDAIFLHQIVEHDGNTQFILHDPNQKGCELWGYSRENILSGNFDLLALNNPPHSFEEATRRNLLAAAGKPQLFDWEHKRANGSKVWGEVNLRRIQIGGKAFLLAVTRNIDERKATEQALQTREREFRTLAANLPVAVIRYDSECCRSYINPTAQRMLRGSDAELLGQQPGGSTVPATPSMIEYYRSKMKEVLTENAPRELEFVLDALPAEQQEYYEVRFAPEYGAGRQPCGVLAIWYDITERKYLEDRLRRREQEFRALSENSPDTIMRYDLECRRIYVNPAFIELVGLPEENLLGGTPTQYSSAPQAQAYENALRRVLQSGEPGEHEYTWPAKGGREIISHFRLIPERDADGMMMSVLAIGRDITAYKKAEAALQKNFLRLTELHRHLEEQTVELEASQEQLKQALEFSEGVVNAIPDILFEMDGEGRYHNVWTQHPEMLAAQKEILVGKTVHEVLSPEAAACAMEAIREADQKGCVYGKVIAITQANGETRWYDHSLAKKVGSTDSAPRFIALSRDITEQKRMQEALVMSEQELRTLIDNSPDTIARYDRNCRRVYANSLFAGLVEGGAAALLDKTPKECPGGENSDMYETKLREVFASGENSEFELQWTDQERHEVCSHIRLTAERDSTGNVVSVLAVGRDISELNLHRKRIYQMAFYDTLTSLPNRALFNDRMNQMLTDAQWHKQQAGVMLLDLDRFKAVNDTLGHAAGDELLRNTSERLSYCVRGYDTVSRLSGDEFAILLPEVRSGDDLGRVARKILESFNEPFILEGKEVFVGCSIGIAVYPADGESAEDLLKQADSAMYFAKRSGRNTFRFYSSDLMDSANERLMLETDLRHGFVRGELELYYQPKIRLTDGVVVGSEALLRWHHPERGMVPPPTPTFPSQKTAG